MRRLRLLPCLPQTVSIHAPVKGATRFVRHCIGGRGVSIHAPVKGAGRGVSIHAPVKGATYSEPSLGVNNSFNSRTRKGCDDKSFDISPFKDVSIHAPVKGATKLQPVILRVNMVSIHAPVKGATTWCWRASTVAQVSIHAPVKGATNSESVFFRTEGFNSRTRKGCDIREFLPPVSQKKKCDPKRNIRIS